MSNLILSPTLYRICERSERFNRHFYRETLNVCNVVRSLMYVILVKDVLLTVIAALVLNGVLQVFFVMATFGLWSPLIAVDRIMDALPWRNGVSFDPTVFTHWWTAGSLAISMLFAAFGTVIVLGLPVVIGIFYLWTGVKKLWRSDATDVVFNTVLSPAGVVTEWIASRHNKVCVYIKSEVKQSTKQRLEDQMLSDLHAHRWAVAEMSLAQLTAQVERTRNQLLTVRL